MGQLSDAAAMFNDLELDRKSRIPAYVQIAAHVRNKMIGGVLKIGDRLPPNRELARRLEVHRTTVTTAYAELEADGLISSQVGRGTFVSALPAPSATTIMAGAFVRGISRRSEAAPSTGASLVAAASSSTPVKPSPMNWSAILLPVQRDRWLSGLLHSSSERDVISFAHGLPESSLFPTDDFRRSVDRVLRREGQALLQLGATSGYAPLLEFLCSNMARDGINVRPDEVLITNGCQQSLDLIRRILVGEGDEIAIEEPTYPGAISVFCSTGSRYATIPVSAAGMDLTVLEDVLMQRRPKLIYTVPTFHNPTGVTMSLSARRRLLELAVRYRVPIIEDDIYRELHYEGPMLPSLKALDQHDVVISINSFSKVGFPGLRVGWIAAPRIVVQHLNIAKQNSDLHASLLTQAAIFEFSRHGLLAKHIRKVRKEYATRRDLMIGAMEKHFPAGVRWNKPLGGMAIWVNLPEQLTAGEVLMHSAERGVVFSPGEHFFTAVQRHNSLRLCFTMASPAKIEEGVKRLGAIIKDRLSVNRKTKARRTASLRALV